MLPEIRAVSIQNAYLHYLYNQYHVLPRLSDNKLTTRSIVRPSSTRLSRPTPLSPGWIYLYARPPLVRVLSLTDSPSHRSAGHTIPLSHRVRLEFRSKKNRASTRT